MIYLTQLVYVREGHEKDFREFEDKVLPLLTKYRGELLLRLRLERTSFVAGSFEAPCEVHLVSFETENDLSAYSRDEERRRYLPLKDSSVRKTVLVKGELA